MQKKLQELVDNWLIAAEAADRCSDFKSWSAFRKCASDLDAVIKKGFPKKPGKRPKK